MHAASFLVGKTVEDGRDDVGRGGQLSAAEAMIKPSPKITSAVRVDRRGRDPTLMHGRSTPTWAMLAHVGVEGGSDLTIPAPMQVLGGSATTLPIFPEFVEDAEVAALIETWERLPRHTGGDAAYVQESLWFDLKETYALDKLAEMAKDVAAFANAEGGAIIIGALEGATGPDYSQPLSAAYAAKLEDAFDKVVRDFCRPSPSVHARAIPVPGVAGKVVLVVNIDPLVDQPVAARHDTSQDAWRFPRRVGRHTEFLLPEQLPLYMDSKARRAKLLLLRVLRSGGKIDLFAVPAGNSTHETIRAADEFDLEEVDSDESGSIIVRQSDEGRQAVSIPIDDVEAVWLQRSGRWAVRISGRLDFFSSADGTSLHELFYLPPSTFVVSPLGVVLKDIPKNLKEVTAALRNTLVVRHHPRREPSEAEVSQVAHERWRFRQERGIAGSPEADWEWARARIFAATRDA